MKEETDFGVLCDDCKDALVLNDKKILISICYNCKEIIGIYYMQEEQEDGKICYTMSCKKCKTDSEETNLFSKFKLN